MKRRTLYIHGSGDTGTDRHRFINELFNRCVLNGIDARWDIEGPCGFMKTLGISVPVADYDIMMHFHDLIIEEK